MAFADRLVQWAQRLAAPLMRPAPAQPGLETAEESQAYFQIYASYADAMIAAARRAGQDIAFVWEPALGNLDGLKPLSDGERGLLKSIDSSPSGEAVSYRWTAELTIALSARSDALARVT